MLPLFLLLLLQVSLEVAQRELSALQEISCHQKKRSAEILNLLLRDLSEIGAVLGTSELRAVSETATVTMMLEEGRESQSAVSLPSDDGEQWGNGGGVHHCSALR